MVDPMAAAMVGRLADSMEIDSVVQKVAEKAVSKVVLSDGCWADLLDDLMVGDWAERSAAKKAASLDARWAGDLAENWADRWAAYSVDQSERVSADKLVGA